MCVCVRECVHICENAQLLVYKYIHVYIYIYASYLADMLVSSSIHTFLKGRSFAFPMRISPDVAAMAAVEWPLQAFTRKLQSYSSPHAEMKNSSTEGCCEACWSLTPYAHQFNWKPATCDHCYGFSQEPHRQDLLVGCVGCPGRVHPQP